MRIPSTWLSEFVSIDLSRDHLVDLLTMGIAEVESVSEVEGEDVFQLELKPDRGDCLSVEAVAREVAALANVPFQHPGSLSIDAGFEVRTIVREGESGMAGGIVPISIEDPDLCPRYAGCVVEGITVGPSPEWLQRRIRQVGLRPVNNVVDATNFVMFEIGQPLHAFDLDKLAGPAIIVRRARAGESLVAINGDTYALADTYLAIADQNHPVAIAGVMGGIESEVSAATTRLLLESAHFDPVSVRMTSRALGLKSDASYRFERSVDPTGCVRALARVAGIIRSIAGGRVVWPAVDVCPRPASDREVRLRPDRVSHILGMPVKVSQIEDAFRRLDLAIRWDAGILVVTVPPRRADLGIEEDLVEEVIRIIGYENLPSTLPVATQTTGKIIPESIIADIVRDALVGTGYTEIRSYSLTSPVLLERCGEMGRAAVLRNPTSSDRTVLRPALLPSVLEAAAANIVRGFRSQHLFEIGRVFEMPGETVEPTEKTHLAGAGFGTAWRSAWNLPAAFAATDFFAVRGTLENVAAALRIGLRFEQATDRPAMHPGRTASVHLADEPETLIGYIGELHPDVAERLELPRPIVFELDMAPLIKAHQRLSRRPVDLEISRQPPATRDLAIVVSDQIPVARILDVIRGVDPIVTSAEVFDLYRGPGLDSGYQSVAVSLVLRAPGRTLTDAAANGILDRIVARLGEEFGAKRR